MSDDFGIDLDEVRRVIANSEVLIIRLETVGSRVLVDFRSNATEPPFISRVPRVNSVEERIRAVKELRPDFPYPEKLMAFAWPRRVSTIGEAGLWELVQERLESIGGEAAGEAAAQVHRELLEEEHREVLAAVRGGEGMRTIWQRE